MNSPAPLAPETGPGPLAPIASTRHTVRFVAVFLGVSALLAWGASQVGSSASPGATATPAAVNLVPRYLGMLAFLWGLFWFAARGMRAHGTPLREVIGGRWRSAGDVLVTIATSLVFLAIAHLVLFGIKAAFVAMGQDTVAEGQRTSALLLPHTFAEIFLWVLLSASAGFCEEVVFRGYLQRQFAALTRHEGAGLALSALVFGLGHAYQGWRSAIVITVYGLLFGALARLTRSLRPGILAHALQDLTAGLFPGWPG